RILEHVVLHGQAVAGEARDGRYDRLQGGVQTLGSRPMNEPYVARALHSDLAVAPRLFADPVNDAVRVLNFVLPGFNLVPAEPLAARIGRHTDVAVRRGELSLIQTAVKIGVNVEEQARGLTRGHAFSAHHDGR